MVNCMHWKRLINVICVWRFRDEPNFYCCCFLFNISAEFNTYKQNKVLKPKSYVWMLSAHPKPHKYQKRLCCWTNESLSNTWSFLHWSAPFFNFINRIAKYFHRTNSSLLLTIFPLITWSFRIFYKTPLNTDRKYAHITGMQQSLANIVDIVDVPHLENLLRACATICVDDNISSLKRLL